MKLYEFILHFYLPLGNGGEFLLMAVAAKAATEIGRAHV